MDDNLRVEISPEEFQEIPEDGRKLNVIYSAMLLILTDVK